MYNGRNISINPLAKEVNIGKIRWYEGWFEWIGHIALWAIYGGKSATTLYLKLLRLLVFVTAPAFGVNCYFFGKAVALKFDPAQAVVILGGLTFLLFFSSKIMFGTYQKHNYNTKFSAFLSKWGAEGVNMKTRQHTFPYIWAHLFLGICAFVAIIVQIVQIVQ